MDPGEYAAIQVVNVLLAVVILFQGVDLLVEKEAVVVIF